MIEQKVFDRGAILSNKGKTVIPGDVEMRMTRDNMLVEPLDACWSALLTVVHETKPLRGIVRAVGPGTYPKRYDHAEKHKRTRMWNSKVFRPTQVKVGDTVELGGGELRGYNFETVYWGDKLMVVCREEDVAAIVEDA